MEKTIPDKIYFKIGEVSELVGVESHVLRYWESEFNIVKPSRTKTKQRLYKKEDVELLMLIKKLLYDNKFTLEGAKKVLQGLKGSEVRHLISAPPESEHRYTLNQVKKELINIKNILS